MSEQVTLLANGGVTVYVPNFFTAKESDRLSSILSSETNWEDHGSPRLVAWVGDFDYSYSRITHKAAPWTPTLQEIRKQVEEHTFGKSEGQYQGVLLNLYRDGNDSVAYHADNESMISQDDPIASISFGATRTFSLNYVAAE